MTTVDPSLPPTNPMHNANTSVLSAGFKSRIYSNVCLHIHNTVCIFRTRVQTIYKSYHVEIHTQMVNTRWLAILYVFGYSVERKVFIKL